MVRRACHRQQHLLGPAPRIPWGTKESAWNLARITDECRKINPDFITAGEGVGQAHGRTLTFGLASAVFHRSELYRYTFPTHLVMDGTANGGDNWSGKEKRFNTIFLNGDRFDNLPRDATFAKNTITLRPGAPSSSSTRQPSAIPWA